MNARDIPVRSSYHLNTKWQGELQNDAGPLGDFLDDLLEILRIELTESRVALLLFEQAISLWTPSPKLPTRRKVQSI